MENVEKNLTFRQLGKQQFCSMIPCRHRHLRFQRKIDHSWGHQYQWILDIEVGILRFFAFPDFMQALATDAPAEMCVQLERDPVSKAI